MKPRALISPRAHLVVGQKLSSVGGHSRTGIVTEIEGEQRPETIESVCRVLHTGGLAYFTIAWNDGSMSLRVPEAIVRNWEIYDDIATQAEIAEAIANHLLAQGLAKEEEKAQAEAREKRRQEALTKYAHLERPGACRGAKLAAKNIRTELKAAFPGIKFSVKSDLRGCSSVDVGWDLGPSARQVDAIIKKYEQGSFNGMEDIYEYDRDNVFPDLFGGARYVTSRRGFGPEEGMGAFRTVAEELCRLHKLPLPASESSHDPNAFWRTKIPGLGEDVAVVARQIILSRSYPPGAKVTGIRERTLPAGTHFHDWWDVLIEAPAPPQPKPKTFQQDLNELRKL